MLLKPSKGSLSGALGDLLGSQETATCRQVKHSVAEGLPDATDSVEQNLQRTCRRLDEDCLVFQSDQILSC